MQQDKDFIEFIRYAIERLNETYKDYTNINCKYYIKEDTNDRTSIGKANQDNANI